MTVLNWARQTGVWVLPFFQHAFHVHSIITWAAKKINLHTKLGNVSYNYSLFNHLQCNDTNKFLHFMSFS